MSAVVVPGSIGVEHGTSWESLTIQWGTASRYNHAVIAETLDPGHPELVGVIEASGGGVRRRWVRKDRCVWDTMQMSEAKRLVVVESARECINIPYNWWDIAKFALRIGRTARRIPGPPYHYDEDFPDKRVICSELASWCLRQAGVDPLPGVRSADISPGDIADFLFRNDDLVVT